MTTVELTAKNYRCFPDEHPLRLTIGRGFTSFVGVNNAGKSSILRLFWELGPVLKFLSSPTGNHINALGGNIQTQVGFRTLAGEQIFSKLNERAIELRFSWTTAVEGDQPETTRRIAVTVTVPRGQQGYLLALELDGTRGEGNFQFSEDTKLKAGNLPAVDVAPFFESCGFLGSAMYLGPFRNTINVGANEPYFDITVGQQFAQQFQTFKSGNDPAANEAIYLLIQDIKRIFGFNELDINADADRKTLQVFIDGRSFRLSELGTGMAQFILVLANVLVRQPSMVLIDEPEASLHPTLQLDFLTTLAAYTTNSSVLFATHNLGLARAASDRIYSCRRLALGVSEVRPLEATPHLAEFLGELGFSAYRDLGFESILLVEGPADVKTMQQFLRIWKKDHEVVLLPLGGASMINERAEAELAEISRISPKVSAVIDSERESASADLSPDRAAFVALCDKLGIAIHVLDRRAIENYLSEPAVKRALGEAYRGLGPFELLRNADPNWGKRDDWRIAHEMSRKDLESTDLGKFLAKL